MFAHWLKDGGFIMYPLVICSVLIWAVIFEKFLRLGRFKREFRKVQRRAARLIQEKRLEEVRGLFSSADPLIGRPHMEILQTQDKALFEDRLDRRLSETQLGLKRFLWVLGTIGSMSPFIGLFGTVVGIIKAFESMAKTGKGGFTVVASGLSEALISTAAGILVAIVAVMFYNYFLIKLSAINLEFKNKLQDLSDLLQR